MTMHYLRGILTVIGYVGWIGLVGDLELIVSFLRSFFGF